MDAPSKDFVEGLAIKGFISCDQPHKMEDMLHFQVTKGDADALGSPREIGEYANREFSQLCIDRVAAQLGLSPPAFRERNDIAVYVGATSTQSWSSDPSTREVACLASPGSPA